MIKVREEAADIYSEVEDSRDFFENGYSHSSTILAFGLNDLQMDILDETIKTLKTFDKVFSNDKKIRIYETDEVTDIYAIPYFMAFINGEYISTKDLEGLIGFWRECAEPLPEDLINNGYQDSSSPLVYLYNCQPHINERIPGLHLDKEFFTDREKLRLTILSELKNNEGKGTAGESSIRITRVLRMYKCLLDEGRLTKQMADKLSYPEVVSQRMFYKDLALINDIEGGRIAFDRKIKAYVLKDGLIEK
ncbi:MAG: hypothetical protein ACOX3R_09325 [Desulfitobacteriia bacterium]